MNLICHRCFGVIEEGEEHETRTDSDGRKMAFHFVCPRRTGIPLSWHINSHAPDAVRVAQEGSRCWCVGLE